MCQSVRQLCHTSAWLVMPIPYISYIAKPMHTHSACKLHGCHRDDLLHLFVGHVGFLHLLTLTLVLYSAACPYAFAAGHPELADRGSNICTNSACSADPCCSNCPYQHEALWCKLSAYVMPQQQVPCTKKGLWCKARVCVILQEQASCGTD